jgi:alkaline phosphatase
MEWRLFDCLGPPAGCILARLFERLAASNAAEPWRERTMRAKPGTGSMCGTASVVVLAALVCMACDERRSDAGGTVGSQVGNAIFIHPDGTALNHWNVARAYWAGPDEFLEWDRLPSLAAYRGHMFDRLTATSNGGATAHAFGYKVQGPDSYGQDRGRPIKALSGYPGSLMREAAAAGHPVGVVNDGDAGEPGTGAFLAEVELRYNATEIARQIVDGRPDFDDPPPAVVLGGGERNFLPDGLPRCVDVIQPDCAVHEDPLNGRGPARNDGRNLIQEAIDSGWVVLRTREAFEKLRTELDADAEYAPRVLGLFAADDIFNDAPEETIARAGLVDESRPADDRRGRLIIWGDRPGTLGYDPPTAAEMTHVALTILERRSRTAGLPFLLVVEVESTDNLPNNNNAIGTLRALKRADDVIGVAREFQARIPGTTIVTAADSDAAGFQLIDPPPIDRNGWVTGMEGNPTGIDSELLVFSVDGIEGRRSPPFVAAPDAFGTEFPFAVSWVGTPDVAGGILARAQGARADLLGSQFSTGFDNTDVYRLLYLALFNKELPPATGVQAPDR